MMYYSQVLLKGAPGEPDLGAGLAWLRRAAEAGNWWATGDHGRLYDEGWYGLPPNPREAAAWKRIRADLGDAEARGWLAAHGYPVD
jgi:TPR repeat protein